ncbi:cytochrome P450 [Ilyonectria robusta]|uniref:cytochrome P450 n=1 Tax=Ilyonectria robusta TaxID=1079257 RepID=UPI001E8D6FE5|nr:cytochrome P450 [Ilyonectria robusta]KAH8677106.1 cytochrome P450 [Ilyonectria robusta]
MAFLSAIYLLFGAVISAVTVAYFRGYGMRPKSYPPGPPTLPIIGNLHQMPMTNLHLKLQEWTKQYGPIISLKLGTQDMVVVSSDKIVRDLIDKRSAIYSGRMDVFIREFGDDLNILMRDNDEIWRRQRKMYHLRLNVNVANKYVPYQQFEVTQLLHDILHSPLDYEHHTKRFTTSLASTIIYGWRTTSVDNPHVKSMFELMDWWPELRGFFRNAPLWITGISKEMERLKNLEEDLWMDLLNEAKSSIEHGSQRASKLRRFTTDMILNNGTKSGDFLSDRQMAANAGHAFAGATDTTLNTTLGFIKAMMLHPEIQAKAQAEIDAVVGSNRMPGWSDWDNLPYIRCTMKETLRWMPSTILGGMPHRLSKTDQYDGYTIPANAGVMINVWGINNDENRAKNPRDFDPSRYEGDNLATGESAALGDASKRDHFTFGSGRRICPGMHVAERSVFVTIARLLWTFKISQPLDTNGQPAPIGRDAVTPGFIVSPVSFLCNFTARDEKRAAMLDNEWENCLTYLDKDQNYTEEFYEKHFSEHL